MQVIQIPKAVLFVSEAASLLGYSSHFVYELIHSGKLYAYKNPGCKTWKIPVEAIMDYLNSQKNSKSFLK